MNRLFWPIIGATIGLFLGFVLTPLVLPSSEQFEVKRLEVRDGRVGGCPLVDYDVRLARETHARIEYSLLRESASGNFVWVDSGSVARDLFDSSHLPHPLDLGRFTANEITCPSLPGRYILQVKYQLDAPSRWAPHPKPIRVISEPFTVAGAS